jgi:nucleotide-binding universal stress UspA family protein
MNPAKSILVATDFSDISERATAYAVDLARLLGARVTFLHVYEIPVYSFFDGALVATSDLAASVSAAADGAMATLVAKQKASGVPVEGMVRVGPPADEVQRVAEEVKADMIVVGTHGRRGLARAFLGSVAEIVVRTSTRPVVVVPSPQAA